MIQARNLVSLLVAALLSIAGPADAQGQDRAAALERAYEEVVAAEAVLQKAEAAREQGTEPLPGERLGIRAGGSRLAPQYWERQEKLEKDVEQARVRLDQALARWNALR